MIGSMNKRTAFWVVWLAPVSMLMLNVLAVQAWFHAVLGLATCYIAMTLTNWNLR